MVALIILAVLCSYLFIGGLIGNWFYAGRKQRCEQCKRRSDSFSPCNNDHGAAAILAGLFWLPVLPAIGGMYVSRALEPECRKERANLRHERRMDKINAENESRRLENEKTRLDIRFLEENGVRADVDGLFQTDDRSK